jgi:drug/metabolite transporter (DMT)-like permease
MTQEKNQKLGHLYSLITIFVWGITFISTKVLLESFQPIEILIYRFIIGLIMLFIIQDQM